MDLALKRAIARGVLARQAARAGTTSKKFERRQPARPNIGRPLAPRFR